MDRNLTVPARGAHAPEVGRLRPRRGMAALAAGILLVAGCTGGGPPGEDPTAPTTDSSPVPETPTPPAATPTGEPVEIKFRYQPPESPCPPVSALDTLPLTAGRQYRLVDPFFRDAGTYLWEICGYERADIGEEAEDMILEDHVRISAEISLFREWSDSSWSEVYPELPIGSDDLADWSTGRVVNHQEVWWEGCGRATPCGADEEPTVRTHTWKNLFTAHAGNLEFYVRVNYIAEALPLDVESRNVEIFRDFVLAAMADRERVD